MELHLYFFYFSYTVLQFSILLVDHDNPIQARKQSQDCDILAAMYNGICIGWTYMPIVNEAITLAVNFDDGVTPLFLVEGYPLYTPGVYEPIISFNFYDTSEGIKYY